MTTLPAITIGLDLGDARSHFCVLDHEGQVTGRGSVGTTRAGVRDLGGCYPRARVVLEVGTHSPWVSRLLAEFGHDVVVANARKVKAVCAATHTSDRVDAETLARLGRFDRALLAPITHRGAAAQRDLAQLQARDAVVRARRICLARSGPSRAADPGAAPRGRLLLHVDRLDGLADLDPQP
ncbi:MAG: IS110 family transposase [Gemmatimonadales bacterium]